MLRAASAFLHGKPVGRPGRQEMVPPAPSPPLLPRLFRQKVLPAGESVDPEQQLRDDAEHAARWMTERYPRRRYPAVALGRPSGALVYLCAALGIPWLPESYQVPVRKTPRLPEAEPSRPMLPPQVHYRVSRRDLGAAYKAFLSRRLSAGGSILVVDRRTDAGATGSPGQDIHTALLEDVLDFAHRRGAAVVRLAFGDPRDLSPLVADLYSWWYRRRGIIARRLLATSLIVTDPLWTFRVGAVPFWLEFIAEPSAASLEHYLEMRPPFDYINLCLFHHERAAADLLPVQRWQGLLARAKRRGDFIGVDAASYPVDFSSFGRYQAAIKRIPARYPLPAPLPLEDFGGFLRYAERYRLVVESMDGRVRWLG